MQKTSFLEIMRTLDREELKRFETFLNSPYFNTRSHVVRLFSVIKKYAPAFDDKDLDKEEIWKKISPGKDYNYGILKNIIYDITKLAERFLEIEEFSSNEHQRMKNLLIKLSDKHLENIFMNKFNSYEKNYIRSSKFYNEYYGEYYELMRRKFVMQAYDIRLRSKNISGQLAELLIFDFIAKFSNNFNNIYIEETELNEVPENNFIKVFSSAVFSNSELTEYLEILGKGSDKNYKILSIFFKLMRSYLNPHSIEFYYDFKNSLFENDKFISESAMRGLYASLGSALDNCDDVKNVNKNRELYEIIYHLADKNIFLSEDGKAIPSLYTLAVKTAGYLKEKLFIERLIKDYLPKIDPDLRDNFEIFSLAYLHYSCNEFERSLEYSNKINIDSFQMKYFLRNLQIIISFEKDDYEMFQYLSDSHRHFLSKNKSVSERYKESNLKFLNYINSLFKLREAKDKTESAVLKNLLEADTVVNKPWLLEKLSEMI